MATRTKRTYNLRPETVSQVREIAGRYGAATSQDAVVELAVERLYREVRDEQEAALWSEAANDPAFRSEVRSIAGEFGDRSEWPA